MIWLPPADWPIPLFFCLFRWPAPCLWLYSACPLNRFDAFGQGAAEKSSAESEQILQNTLLDKKRKAKRKGYLSPSLTSMEPTISPSGEIPFSTSQFGKKYRSPVQSTNHHKNRSFEICARDDSCKRSIVYRSTGAKTRFFCSEQQDRNPDNEPADAGRMADAIRYFPQECRS